MSLRHRLMGKNRRWKRPVSSFMSRIAWSILAFRNWQAISGLIPSLPCRVLVVANDDVERLRDGLPGALSGAQSWFRFKSSR